MNTSVPKPKGRIMGIDYGRRRVGVALSDPSWTLATAYKTLTWTRPDLSELIAALQAIVDKEDVRRVVLGMPYRTDGKPGEMEAEVKHFSQRFQADIGLRAIYVDESYSSVEAEEILSQSQRRRHRKERQAVRDQLAAELILQTYLDSL